MTMSIQETCARCGHKSLYCEACGRSDPFLGAGIGDKKYCHTFSLSKPTCYMLEQWGDLPKAGQSIDAITRVVDDMLDSLGEPPK